jgi:hypothetical protein
MFVLCETYLQSFELLELKMAEMLASKRKQIEISTTSNRNKQTKTNIHKRKQHRCMDGVTSLTSLTYVISLT